MPPPELLRDICPEKCSAAPANLCISPEGISFTAVDEFGARKLWTTDGSTAGTYPIGHLPGDIGIR